MVASSEATRMPPDAESETPADVDSARPADAERATIVSQLFAQHRRSLHRYLTDLLARRDEAEDVLQESYLRLLALESLDSSPVRARALLYRIATNLAYDRFRSRRVRNAPSVEDLAVIPSDEPSPEGILALDQGLAEIKRTLLELKPRCRNVFLLRAVEGLGYDEIARRLGTSKRTVEREMRHALDICQRRLKTDRR